jgi:NAD(P)H-hydrate epimerase
LNDGVNAKIAALLQQVGEVHHQVFADTQGSDDDWATFYSDWLLAHSDLPALLGQRPIRSHLTRDLVELDEQFTAAKPVEQWPVWYAARLIAKYA